MQLWLERSRNIPLHVYWSRPTASHPLTPSHIEAFVCVMRQLSRIQYLAINVDFRSKIFQTAQLDWRELAAPHLRTIELETRVNWYSGNKITPCIVHLLDSYPIHLESLTLSDKYLKWEDLKSPLLSSVKFFCFRTSRFTAGQVMLDTLSCCSSLEELHLIEDELVWGPDGDDTAHDDELIPTSISSSIALPHLGTIFLVAHISTLVEFLPILHKGLLQSSPRLCVMFQPDDEIDNVLAISIALNQYVFKFPCEDSPITTLALDGDGSVHLTFRCWRTSVSNIPELCTHSTSHTDAPAADITVEFDMAAISTPYTYWASTLDVLSEISLHHVQTLFLSAMPQYVFQSDFRYALRQMHEIETLHVEGWTSRALLNLLYTHPRHDTGTIFMPRLRKVYLHEVHFPLEGFAETALLLSRFCLRKVYGNPVETLILDSCYNVTSTVIDILQVGVKEVIWDRLQLPGDVEVWQEPKRDMWDEEEVEWGGDAIFEDE